jgi:hypothetical protein
VRRIGFAIAGFERRSLSDNLDRIGDDRSSAPPFSPFPKNRTSEQTIFEAHGKALFCSLVVSRQ